VTVRIWNGRKHETESASTHWTTRKAISSHHLSVHWPLLSKMGYQVLLLLLNDHLNFLFHCHKNWIFEMTMTSEIYQCGVKYRLPKIWFIWLAECGNSLLVYTWSIFGQGPCCMQQYMVPLNLPPFQCLVP